MIIQAKNLGFHYHADRPVFRDVSFELRRGEILTILGTNGAGKSTLLNCIANLYKPQQGCIYLKGKPITEYDLRETARIIGYVPQNHAPVYDYTVREYVVMGRAPHLKTFQQPREEDYAAVDSILASMDLTRLADRPYTQLSGGERQQVSIARAIVRQPEVIMLDEPVNHLDYGNQLRALTMVNELAGKGYAVIMTSHNPDHAMLLNCRVGILDRSGRLAVGSAEEILTEELLRDLYNSEICVTYVDRVKRNVCMPMKLG